MKQHLKLLTADKRLQFRLIFEALPYSREFLNSARVVFNSFDFSQSSIKKTRQTKWVKFCIRRKSKPIFFLHYSMFGPGSGPVLVLSQNTKRDAGKKVQMGNINAGKTIGDVVRTCLGPKAMLKMLISSINFWMLRELWWLKFPMLNKPLQFWKTKYIFQTLITVGYNFYRHGLDGS